MFSLYSCVRIASLPAQRWSRRWRCPPVRPNPRVCHAVRPISSSLSQESAPLDYDPSKELLGLDVEPQPRNINPGQPNARSWFGPNGQYIRELPCPCCRGRGYTPCTECDIERSRSDCLQCNGKGIISCPQCSGDCVVWEESIDEQPWEKARSSSPLKVTEDEEVDKLDIKVDTSRKPKRKYHSSSPEVNLKISRSLRSLNAKTGLFSKRMKIIHQDPVLRAQRVAAIKRTKRSPEARKRASENMKAYFSNPENRLKRSIIMKGAKYYCSNCGKEGHRRFFCPVLRAHSGKIKFKCRICGESGHNQRTCKKTNEEPDKRNNKKARHCRLCGQRGHNSRTCLRASKKLKGPVSRSSSKSVRKIYSCSLCLENGHNKRRCPKREHLIASEQ